MMEGVSNYAAQHQGGGGVAQAEAIHLACQETLAGEFASPIERGIALPKAPPGAPGKSRRRLLFDEEGKRPGLNFSFGAAGNASKQDSGSLLPTLATLADIAADPGLDRALAGTQTAEPDRHNMGHKHARAAEPLPSALQTPPAKRRACTPSPATPPPSDIQAGAPVTQLCTPITRQPVSRSEPKVEEGQAPLPCLALPSLLGTGTPAGGSRPRLPSSPADVAWDDQHIVLPRVKAIRTRSAPMAAGVHGLSPGAAPTLRVKAAFSAPAAGAQHSLASQFHDAELGVLKSRAESLARASNPFAAPAGSPMALASPTSATSSRSTNTTTTSGGEPVRIGSGAPESAMSIGGGVRVMMLPFGGPSLPPRPMPAAAPTTAAVAAGSTAPDHAHGAYALLAARGCLAPPARTVCTARQLVQQAGELPSMPSTPTAAAAAAAEATSRALLQHLEAQFAHGPLLHIPLPVAPLHLHSSGLPSLAQLQAQAAQEQWALAAALALQAAALAACVQQQEARYATAFSLSGREGAAARAATSQSHGLMAV